MRSKMTTIIFTLLVTFFGVIPGLGQNIAPTLDNSFGGVFGCNELAESDGYNAVGVTSCDNPAATVFQGTDGDWSGDVGSRYLGFCGEISSDGTYFPFGDPIRPYRGSSDCRWIVGGNDYIYHNGTFFDGSGGVPTFWDLIVANARGDAFALGSTSGGTVLAKYSGVDNHRVFVKNVAPGSSLARDKAGNIYIAGGSTVTKYAPNATKVIYQSSIPNVWIGSISVDQYGEVYATGTTSGGMPVVYAPQPQPGGGLDGFLVVLSSKGDRIVYSSYLGGKGTDVAVGVKGGGGASVQGTEQSWDWDGRENFCPGEDTNCSEFVFVSSFGPFRNSSLPAKLAFGPRDVDTTHTRKALFKVLGDIPLNVTSIRILGDGYTQTNTCTTPVKPDKTCSISVSFSPLSSGEHDGTLIVTSDSLRSPQVVTLTGSGK